MRMALVPATSFASKILPIIILVGFLAPLSTQLGTAMIMGAILAYLVLTVFQLITLPVEFDASKRAKEELVGLGILAKDELPGVNQTLNAAAFTYVAAFIASLATLLYYVLVLLNSRR
jgi:Zn-dependent membrane protease YugP